MNIKLITSIFVVLVLVAMSVTAAVDFTVPASVSVQDQADTTKTVDITITNTGDALNSFLAVYTGDTEDNDGDVLTYSFAYPASIANGTTGVITMTVAIGEDVDTGDYDGTISIRAKNNVSDDWSLPETVASTVKVTPEVCKSGVNGDLEVSVDEPDSGETFKPGEEVNIDVNVENNDNSDMDVKVVAILYNLDEDDEVKKVTSDVVEINDGDDQDFELTMTLPTSLDEGDHYVLYVKAYEDGHESRNCEFESPELQIERDSHDVVVTEIKLLPETVECGQKVGAQVKVENAGTDNEDDVYVEFFAKDFSYRKDSETFDLDEYDDSDNDYVAQFELAVPKNAQAGEYFVEAVAHYNDGDTHSLMQKMVVTCDAGSQAEVNVESSAQLQVLNQNLKVLDGGKLSLEIVLKNTGSEPMPVMVDVTEAQWADVLGVEAPSILYPGDEFHAYAYLKLKQGVEAGKHNLRVNLRKESGLIASKLVTVNVETPAENQVTGTVTAPVTSSWKSWFTQKPKLFWIVADLVLVALAVLFVRLLFKK